MHFPSWNIRDPGKSNCAGSDIATWFLHTCCTRSYPVLTCFNVLFGMISTYSWTLDRYLSIFIPRCITSTLSHLVYHLAAVPWLLEQGTGSHKWIRLTGARTCGVKSWQTTRTDYQDTDITWGRREHLRTIFRKACRVLGPECGDLFQERHEQCRLWRYGIMKHRISMVQVPNSTFCLQNLSETSLCTATPGQGHSHPSQLDVE